MSIFDSLRKKFKDDEVKRIIEAFDEARSGEAPQFVVPEVHYFRIRLVELFIRRKAWLLKTFYPAAHGMVQATYAGKDLELPSVVDTSKLFDQQKGTGDVVVRNFPLTPLLPYRGNTVEVLCGLFAMQGENYLSNLIKVMSDFSSLLVMPQLSQGLAVAGPLAAGVQNLFGASDGRMHLGYHDAFVSVIDPDAPADNAFRSGFIAVIRAEDGEIDRSKLRVENQQLRIVDGDTSRPFTDKDHLLLHIEARTERDDLARLSSFYDPFKAALTALGDDSPEKARSLIRQSLAAARISDDLTDADRSRVTKYLKAQYLKTQEDLDFAGLIAGAAEPEIRLQGSAFAARDAGVPSLEELMEDL